MESKNSIELETNDHGDRNFMQKKRPFEVQLTQLSLAASIPLLLLLIWIMVYANISLSLILLSAFIGIILIVYTSYHIYHRSVYQFRRLSNLLDAMIQGDYSLRARSDQGEGALDELIVAINGLAQRLSKQRIESVESQLLTRTIIKHIDVAIVALNTENQISFYNPAAKKLLLLNQTTSATKLLDELSFVHSFSSGDHQVVELSLGYQQGRFNIHVEEFRESGMQHKLLFITDVRTLLRSEERKAWQSLVRVISHEINNSLSPIASISQTLHRLVSRLNDSEINKDLIDGLTIITERAKDLGSFIESYKQLAKLPEPQKQLVSIVKLIEKTCMLFKNQKIILLSETDIELFIDPIQFEQVLINLVKNAIESMSLVNPDGVIRVEWFVNAPLFKLMIYDQGGGISNPDNLFVPFYSTKKNGSGIGLVFCRQVVEAHNGRLSLSNQIDASGCCASIEIPFGQIEDNSD